jgi:hypothetical protein
MVRLGVERRRRPMKNEYVTQAQQMASLWWEMWDQQSTRAAAHTQVAIEECARMAKESIAYQQKLAAEWRKIFFATNGTTAA